MTAWKIGAIGMAVCVMHAISAGAQSRSGSGEMGEAYVEGAGTVKVGGYVDMEFEYNIPSADGLPNDNTFDQHRMVPFLSAEITSAMHFGTEIEYEHGGNVEAGGEINLEYMTLDYRFTEGLNLRTGIILSPLGRFNLNHDSPVNDLTDRPLVDRQIIPTTLSEAGVGFFGTVYPSEMSVLDYEVYIVNGFNTGVVGADSLVRIRDGRGSVKEDNNTAKSLTARLKYSPFLGLGLGLSTHVGHFDDSNSSLLTIVAMDAEYRHGPIELQGELAQLEVDRDYLGLGRQTQRGYVLQANYHFLQNQLLPNSTFTGVVRYDWVDFGVKGSPDERISRLTFGVNFRPVEKAVFKTDFQTNWRKLPGAVTEREDYRIMASVAAFL